VQESSDDSIPVYIRIKNAGHFEKEFHSCSEPIEFQNKEFKVVLKPFLSH
jgi:hypothetical protein